MTGSSLRDCVLGMVGHRRIKLGEWADQGIVAAVMGAVNELGGRRVEKDIGFGFDDVFFFRVCGRRVRLVVEEYGDVTLWGAKRVVTDLSKRIAKRLSAKAHESRTA